MDWRSAKHMQTIKSSKYIAFYEIGDDERMGIISDMKLNLKYPNYWAYYLSGHPNVGETNIKVYIFLYETKLVVYKAFSGLMVAIRHGEISEKTKLFEIPYDKLASTTSQSEAKLTVMAHGQDKYGEKILVPLVFNVCSHVEVIKVGRSHGNIFKAANTPDWSLDGERRDSLKALIDQEIIKSSGVII